MPLQNAPLQRALVRALMVHQRLKAPRPALVELVQLPQRVQAQRPAEYSGDRLVGLSEGHSVDLRADPMGGHLGAQLVGRLEVLKVDPLGDPLVGRWARLTSHLQRVPVQPLLEVVHGAYVAKSIAQHVIQLRLFFVVTGFFCRSFSFPHGGTQFTHMARLK